MVRSVRAKGRPLRSAAGMLVEERVGVEEFGERGGLICLKVTANWCHAKAVPSVSRKRATASRRLFSGMRGGIAGDATVSGRHAVTVAQW